MALPRFLAQLIDADQTGAHRVEGGLGPAVHTELDQDARDVALDCRLADGEAGRYLLVGLAPRQQLQDLGLALG